MALLVDIVELDDGDALAGAGLAAREIVELGDLIDREAAALRGACGSALLRQLAAEVGLRHRPVVQAVHADHDTCELRRDLHATFTHAMGRALVPDLVELDAEGCAHGLHRPGQLHGAGCQMHALDVEIVVMREIVDLGDVGGVRAHRCAELGTREILALARRLRAERHHLLVVGPLCAQADADLDFLLGIGRADELGPLRQFPCAVRQRQARGRACHDFLRL
ncbi:hypothetical protein ABIF64_001228 [Bradyrhizobium japonicum]